MVLDPNHQALPLDLLYCIPGRSLERETSATPSHEHLEIHTFVPSLQHIFRTIPLTYVRRLLDAHLLIIKDKFPGISDDQARSYLPLKPNGKWTLSSMEIFDRGSHECATYYPGWGDRGIIENYTDELCGLLDKTVLIETGAGTSWKTRLLYELMTRKGAHTKASIVNDRYPENVATSIETISKPEIPIDARSSTLSIEEIDELPFDFVPDEDGPLFYPIKDIIPAPGDMYDAATWERKNIVATCRRENIETSSVPYNSNLLDWARKQKTPCRLLDTGARAFNNTTFGQMKKHMEFLDSFPDGTLGIFSADFTQDERTQRECYDNIYFHQLFYTPAIFGVWAAGHDINPIDYRSRVDITRKSALSLIRFVPHNIKTGHELPWKPIRKPKQETIESLAKKNGIEIVKSLPYQDPRTPNANFAWVIMRKKSRLVAPRQP
jgi:hypothetical protein